MKALNSTKFRLTLWYVGVLAIILTVFAAATYIFFDSVLQSQIDSTLSEISSSFENTVNRDLADEGSKNNGGVIDEEIRDATVEVSYRNFKIFVFSADKTLFSVSKATETDSFASAKTAQVWLNKYAYNQQGSFHSYVENGENYRVFFRHLNIQNKKFFLVVVHPLEATETLLEKVRLAFLLGVPLALLLASFGGYLLMRKSFAPIEKMTVKAEEITARNLHERLPIENEDDELGRLARTFNRLLSRLDLSFEQQQRFMADASHELRTPVAIVRGEAEVSLTKDDRPPSEYRETIEIMQKEAERMSRTIEDLFTLARADAGENPVSETNIYLEDALTDTVKAFRSLGAKRGVGLELETNEEMPMLADEQLIKRLFSNLVDNAIRYANSSVKICAFSESVSFIVEVSDDGNGIPAQDQPLIFDRFYRVDKARSRQKESPLGSGAGLGLSIVKWIAGIHGGSIILARSNSEGTTFRVKLPQPKP